METLPRLRPMGLSELLDATFALYRANFALFAGIVAVLAIPQAVLRFIINSVSAAAVTHTVTPTGTVTTVNGGLLGASLLFDLIGGAVTLIFTLLMMGAMAKAVSARYLGRPITIGDAYASIGVSALVTLLIAAILYGIAVTFLFLLLIIPGIYFGVRWLFISQAIILEGRGVGGGFSRSSQLVSGTWWRVFGIVIVLGIIVAILELVVGGVASAIFAVLGTTVGRLFSVIASAIAQILVQPIQLAGMTLLYYDLRIRKEGFDVQQMTANMESPQPA